MSGAANKLARAVVPGPQASPSKPSVAPPRQTRAVVVAALTSTTCTVHIDGDTTVAIPATNSPSVTLTTGDVVDVLCSGTRTLVIGGGTAAGGGGGGGGGVTSVNGNTGPAVVLGPSDVGADAAGAATAAQTAAEAFSTAALATALAGLAPAESPVATAGAGLTHSGVGATVGGVVITAGMRVLDTQTGVSAGLWVAAVGAWTRPVDFATGSNGQGKLVDVDNTGALWVCIASAAVTVDTTSQVWTELDASVLQAGSGLSKTGNTLALALSQALITATGLAASDVGAVSTSAPVVLGMATDPNQVKISGDSGCADRLPASPSAFNDEFEQNGAGTPAGWTAFGSVATVDTNTALSHLHLISFAAAGVQLNGIYKAAPSFPFTMTAKLVDDNIASASQTAGIFVSASTPGVNGVVILSCQMDGGSSLGRVSATKWTDWKTFSAFEGTTFTPGLSRPIYLRIIATSTTSFTLQFSRNGLSWVTLVSAFNPAATIVDCGLFVNPQNATAPEAFFDWVRFT